MKKILGLLFLVVFTFFGCSRTEKEVSNQSDSLVEVEVPILPPPSPNPIGTPQAKPYKPKGDTTVQAVDYGQPNLMTVTSGRTGEKLEISITMLVDGKAQISARGETSIKAWPKEQWGKCEYERGEAPCIFLGYFTPQEANSFRSILGEELSKVDIASQAIKNTMDRMGKTIWPK